jgi:hypothetical protein
MLLASTDEFVMIVVDTLNILSCIDPLLGNDLEINNEYRPCYAICE